MRVTAGAWTYLGAPAVQRLSEELSGGDEDGEEDEQDGRVLAVQSVDQVVVEAELGVTQMQRRLHDGEHCDAAAAAAAAAAGDDGTSTTTAPCSSGRQHITPMSL